MSRPVDSAFSITLPSTEPFVCTVDIMKQAPQLQDSRGRLVQGGVELGSECSERDKVGFLHFITSSQQTSDLET